MVSKAEQRKIGARNSRKGKRNERRVANLLTEWAGQDFRRRRVEGRETSVVLRESTSDIIMSGGEIIFSVEAKAVKGFSMDALLTSPMTNLFTGWWAQTNWDARVLTEITKIKRYPFLIFKPAAAFTWLAISLHAFEDKVLKPSAEFNGQEVWFPHLRFEHYRNSGPIEYNISQSKKNKDMRTFELHPLIFCRWKDFAANVDPQSICVPNDQPLSNS